MARPRARGAEDTDNHTTPADSESEGPSPSGGTLHACLGMPRPATSTRPADRHWRAPPRGGECRGGRRPRGFAEAHLMLACKHLSLELKGAKADGHTVREPPTARPEIERSALRSQLHTVPTVTRIGRH